MRFITMVFFAFFVSSLLAQDCQLAALHINIPAGISKHHFPKQSIPVLSNKDYFTYFTEWDQSDLVIRIRFSEDGNQWTKWTVLKRDYAIPEVDASPLEIAKKQFQYFEWAVYNKAGLESNLTFNFYFPGLELIYADIEGSLPIKLSKVACPQPRIIPITTSVSIVTATDNNEK